MYMDVHCTLQTKIQNQCWQTFDKGSEKKKATKKTTKTVSELNNCVIKQTTPVIPFIVPLTIHSKPQSGIIIVILKESINFSIIHDIKFYHNDPKFSDR